VAGERRRLAVEHEPVDGREEAQREGRASRLAGVLSKHLESGTARLGVVGGVLKQMLVQRRCASRLKSLPLRSQALRDQVGVGAGLGVSRCWHHHTGQFQALGRNAMSKRVMTPTGGDPAAPAVPPHWNVNLRVEDTDAVAAHAANLGGTVIVAPMDTPGVRSAVLLDPSGAAFSVSLVASGSYPASASPCWP